LGIKRTIIGQEKVKELGDPKVAHVDANELNATVIEGGERVHQKMLVNTALVVEKRARFIDGREIAKDQVWQHQGQWRGEHHHLPKAEEGCSRCGFPV